MTTTTAAAPRFATRRGHPALRALVILGLGAALTGGFVASAWRAPAPAAETPSALVRCAPGSPANPC